MKTYTRDQFYGELNRYLRWNPEHKFIRDGKVMTDSDGGKEAEIHRDYDGLLKWMKKEFKEHDKFFNKVGTTVELTAMPLGNLLLHLCPDFDVKDDFDKAVKNGPSDTGRYTHFMDAGVEWKDAMQAMFSVGAVEYKGKAKKMDTENPLSMFLDKISSLPAAKVTVLDNILEMKTSEVDLSSIEEMASVTEELTTTKALLEEKLKDVKGKLSTALSTKTAARKVKVKKDGPIPSGEMKSKKASEIFEGVSFNADLDVPFWEWEHEHPDVPEVDESYIFRPDLLQRVLYCLVTGERGYLQGHTGSGKTTLIEQVAARLNYPFARINFDSEITRMDLIGRDQLSVDVSASTTKSEFVEGILPRVMAGPYITCFDEIDFCRPDVAYVMQAALENNALRIIEDGDRIVTPHESFRMFATGNTVGQGDEHGMYQGARPQSLAFLDRFTVWIRVPYLDEDQRRSLLEDKFPLLNNEDRNVILAYTQEHLSAFEDSRVLQPLSPRGIMALANATQMMGDVKLAFQMTILDKASDDDRATLNGIVDRVVK